ncbi:peptidylprolyl isomerase [Phaeodactylibacter luteus]|uniref:Peptidyl-prolyl cis-trans isomerase n=1 Tax=Phaeodactylibacter luteus TaxID=1564516 RepID=A0A5C6RIS4_9BACT|nr:peptidylprolyl isomerase [Phaeodactylibacter luteus]TXB61884.1 PKD domain-containing protein [Phaeodactylibacter luteus]
MKLLTWQGGILLALLISSCGRPVARFSLESTQQRVLQPIPFDNKSEKAVRYEWDFGDGKTAEAESPEHRYKASGAYTVTLTAYNEKGKARKASQTIEVAPPKACLVEIETELGSMIVELYDATPQHQDNFTKLAEEHYFDSLLFHRVINNFMIQGGDPQSKGAPGGQALGSGGPGYTLPAEFVDSLVHVKGALAAARTGDAVNPAKRSSGSQFYIVHGQQLTEDMLNRIEAQKGIRYTTDQREMYLELGGTPFLDREYTVFGRVIEGLDVIDRLASVPTDRRDRPQNDLRMKIRLIR